MEYNCLYCNKKFVSKEKIDCCPFCGKSYIEDFKKQNEIADTLNILFGEKGKLINKICCSLNFWINKNVAEISSNINFQAKYETKNNILFDYASIRKSQDKKELFQKIEKVLDNIFKTLSVDKHVIKNEIEKCFVWNKDDIQKLTYKAKRRIIDYLSLFNLNVKQDAFVIKEEKLDLSVVVYKQRECLYENVVNLYKTFKMVVNDNSIYAAFVDDDDYGRDVPWFSYDEENNDCNFLNGILKEDTDVQEEIINNTIILIKETMRVPYETDLLLQPEFKTYIQAFWKGLYVLAKTNSIDIITFISDENVDRNKKCSIFGHIDMLTNVKVDKINKQIRDYLSIEKYLPQIKDFLSKLSTSNLEQKYLEIQNQIKEMKDYGNE